MIRPTTMVLLVVLTLVVSLMAGCGVVQQAVETAVAPAVTPSATTAPATATTVPTAIPKPTNVPTVAATPTAVPTAVPTVVSKTTPATTAVSKTTPAPTAATKITPRPSPSGQNTPASKLGIGEMDPDIMKAMATAFPTAPPTPFGPSANLSPNDWAGKWEGWITIDSFKADTMKPEEQKSCDEALAMLKGRQIPQTAEFTPSGSDAGTATFTSEGSQNPEVYNYKYRDGVILIERDEGGAKIRYEGKTIQSSGGLAISGIWKFSGPLSPPGQETQGGSSGSLDGTWTLFRK